MKKEKNKTTKDKTKSDAIIMFFLWILLMFLLIGSDIALLFLEADTHNLIICFLITFFFAALGIYVVKLFIKNISESQNEHNINIPTYLDEQKAKTTKRLKGKDMYEIIDNYRRQYYVTMIIILVISTFLLTTVFIIKMNDYDYLHIPIYWSILIPVIIMIISIIIGYKYDFSFITSLHLKKEIRSHGYDEQRVNNDFMMANYHRLSRGIMAIGQSYYVVFMQNFCRVGQIRGITSIESYSETEKINDGTLTRYFIRIYEDDNTVSYFMCADQIASELIINEFNMLGYEVIDKGNSG